MLPLPCVAVKQKSPQVPPKPDDRRRGRWDSGVKKGLEYLLFLDVILCPPRELYLVFDLP